MKKLTLYYATNRNHIGGTRWNPKSYGTKFSDDGMENLRFGYVSAIANDAEIDRLLTADSGFGPGRGDDLADYLAKKVVPSAKIEAYPELIKKEVADVHQPNAKFGSKAMFADIKTEMDKATDVLIYIHGFNVSWDSAVGSALALQEMLNNSPVRDPNQKVLVVLFTWPSDGKALPFVSYKSDRTEAKGSGYAFGRGLLKFRDFLTELKRSGAMQCNQDVHLLCHSMGNYVLQNTIQRMEQYTPGPSLPRIFENIFLCAPDVDECVLESGNPLHRVQELARSVNVYFNRGDVAMYISDYTKGNPERLGTNGVAHPSLLHNKICQIDCSPVVKGVVEHSYYLCGRVNADIRMSIDGLPAEDPRRQRAASAQWPNTWSMVK